MVGIKVAMGITGDLDIEGTKIRSEDNKGVDIIGFKDFIFIISKFFTVERRKTFRRNSKSGKERN